jgi:putative transposase
MIDRNHSLPISPQVKVVGISRGSLYYLPRPVSDYDQELMRRIDHLHLDFPFAGSRMLRDLLKSWGHLKTSVPFECPPFALVGHGHRDCHPLT